MENVSLEDGVFDFMCNDFLFVYRRNENDF